RTLVVVQAGDLPPPQRVERASLALRRAARAALAERDGCRGGEPRGRGWGAVLVGLGGEGCADALEEELADDDDAFAGVGAGPDLVADADGCRGLGAFPGDADVPGAAGGGGGGPRLVEACGPCPHVDPHLRPVVHA